MCGRFWQCPNGGKDCKYRHALPPGYVLKSQMKVPPAAAAHGWRAHGWRITAGRHPFSSLQRMAPSGLRSTKSATASSMLHAIQLLTAMHRPRLSPDPASAEPLPRRTCWPQALSRSPALQELLAQEMADKKAIEDEIEEDRRKVDAHTPITLQVRRARHSLACAAHLTSRHCV